jgi:UDP-N-acetylglucosamine--N-acetylmuramyl-(pentapeptide) pyrophosphoryl-undecaprenol N-acetylglucosamine transferase
MSASDQPPHVVFTGGGTGGHLFPALAVAQRLRDEMPRARITFVGSGKPFERRHVAAAGFAYLALPCRPLPRRVWRAPAFLMQNAAGYLAARRILREQHVHVVVGSGGYASVPIARAAKGCGASLVLLEQNVVPGRANRWLARRADAVCLAFERTVSRLRCKCAVHVTGTPIRFSNTASPTLDQLPNPGVATPGLSSDDTAPDLRGFFARHRLLILGGSGGAESLNQSVPRALYKVREQLDSWQIIHQSGESATESTRRLYKKLALDAMVVPFVDDVAGLLADTDLAVCRAGGSTLAELATAGVPAVLLPYPHATDDHQRKNADLFCDSGGCLVLDPREVSDRLDHPLAEVLAGLLSDAGRRERMSAAVGRLAQPDAAARVTALIREMLPGQRGITRVAA